MRYLIIKRNKTFLGCLSNLKVYIQDPTATKPVINGTPCRFLGTMKNGEEVCFEIPNEPCRVFVITDKMSKNIISEFIDVPMGEEDVYLTGKCEYGTLGTVMFRFDQIFSQAQLDNRKKGGKNMLIFLAVCVIIGIIAGLGSSLYEPPVEPQVFVENNMEIILTDDFYEEEYYRFDACFISDGMHILVVQEEFTLAEGAEDLTLKEYAKIVLETNDLERLPINEEDGLLWYEYIYDDGLDTFYYYSYLYKSADSFWIIQFCVDETTKDEYRDTITQYAKSVKFN